MIGKKFSVMFTACSQRDFVSPGGSSVSLRNSGIPDLGLQFQFDSKNDSAGREFLIGIGGGYKFITPRLTSDVSSISTITPAYVITDTLGVPHLIPAATKTTTTRYKVEEKMGGFYSVFFTKLKCKPITWKLYAAYGQNIYDLTMLGGYAVTNIKNVSTNQLEYTPFNTLAGWTELMTNGKKIQFGLFGGYTQNMGTTKKIIDFSTTNRGADIKYVYRVSPRVVFISGKFQFMTELELTSAAYASADASGKLIRDDKGVITKTTPATNLRVLFAVQYNF